MTAHEDEAARLETAGEIAVERAARVCKKCGVNEPLQDITDECCWVVSRQRCVFPTVGEDQSGASVNACLSLPWHRNLASGCA